MNRSVLSLILVSDFVREFTHSVRSESDGRAWATWPLHLGR